LQVDQIEVEVLHLATLLERPQPNELVHVGVRGKRALPRQLFRAGGAAILQNGNLYMSSAFRIAGASTTFHPLSLTGLTAASFSLLNRSWTGSGILRHHAAS
jgi:hypothetical protein